MRAENESMYTLTHSHTHTFTPSQIKRPPEIKLTLVPQKSMGGSARNQRPLSIQLIAKYPTDYPDRSGVSITWSPSLSLYLSHIPVDHSPPPLPSFSPFPSLFLLSPSLPLPLPLSPSSLPLSLSQPTSVETGGAPGSNQRPGERTSGRDSTASKGEDWRGGYS